MAMRRMDDGKIHHLPVLNRSKRLVGVLTLSDLATYAAVADLFPFISQLTSRDAKHHAAHLLPSPDCDDPYYGDPYS